jgi:ABC-type multidrug transport system ATPase subunit
VKKIAVEIHQLSKHYGSLKAVDSLQLEISENEIFGFLGPNGAGKSTTLRMMLSLVKPTSGHIAIFGKSLQREREKVLTNIGCIVEKPDFYLHLTAWKNLQMLATLHGVPQPHKRIAEVLELVGLSGREHDKVKTFSHGMKQRLGIAQALLHQPQLIILDEPTTGLDPQGIIDLRHLLLHLKNELGKTIILSSHILSEVELIADSMVIMNKGKAVVQGSVRQLLSNEHLIVKIETDSSERARQALSQSPFSTFIRASDGQSVSLHVSRETIPPIVSFLQQHQVSIFGISYQRPLEEYFLKITQAQ